MQDAKPRVILSDAPKPRVNAEDLAHALGATEVTDAPSRGGSPVTWLALREETARRLRSTGGRPGLEGAEPRKVTLPQDEWDMVRALADSISEPGFRPSAGQVAGILLGRAIRAVTETMPATVTGSRS